MGASFLMLTFDDASHTYEWFGVEIPSLSKLMGELGWGRDFSMVPEHLLELSRKRGHEAHAAIHLYLSGDPAYAEALTDDSIPYFDSFLAVADELPLTDQGIGETPVGGWCGYGTTPDRVEPKALIEWKTTSKIHPAVWIQLAAQEYALSYETQASSFYASRDRTVVHLLKSGKKGKVVYDECPGFTMDLWKADLVKWQWKKEVKF